MRCDGCCHKGVCFVYSEQTHENYAKVLTYLWKEGRVVLYNQLYSTTFQLTIDKVKILHYFLITKEGR